MPIGPAKPDGTNVLLQVNDPSDHPWDEIVRACQMLVAEGKWIQQKFTCAKCRNRLTMETANVLHTHGTCDKCNHPTDIKAQGCNYRMLIASKLHLQHMVDAGLVGAPLRPGLTIAVTDPSTTA